MYNEHDIVAINHDILESNLPVGSIGTIVEVSSDGQKYDVEFIDESGYKSILLTLNYGELRIVWRIDSSYSDYSVDSNAIENTKDHYWSNTIFSKPDKIKDYTVCFA